MTTLRPEIIRADTLDLQDYEAPSAKDHSRQPSHPEPLGEGPAAPHQDGELRHVAEERTAEEQYLARHLTDAFNNNGFDHPQSDEFGFGSGPNSEVTDGLQNGSNGERSAQSNGVASLEGGELGGEERPEEESMDDKISSSPSIDDGGFDHFVNTLQRLQCSNGYRTSESMEELCRLIDMPYTKGAWEEPFAPLYPPLPLNGHHLQGRYGEATQRTQLGQSKHEGIDWEHGGRRVLRRVTTHLDIRNSSRKSYAPVHRASTMFEDEGFGENLVPGETSDTEDDPADVAVSPSGSSWTSFEDDISETEWGEDDDPDASLFSSNPRFVDSGWGGECLREIEDIDFEFVYALHNFVATVEGQANATKGDTMVLLDDSNSYWWLVRIVKDNSIGYLPAEHIETPTERLARLNKHRNIDLSATMLSDNTERSKNPLKKAMRRRNAKIVSFTTPTYFEPPEVDWSEGDDDAMESQLEDGSGRRKGSRLDRIDGNGTEPAQGNAQNVAQRDIRTTDMLSGAEARAGVVNEPTGIEVSDGQDDPTDKVRGGTMRNTDSFYKDDSTGTKKISLTPDLLRDDSSRASLRSPEPTDRGASPEVFDLLGRTSPASDKAQEDKRRKEKKPNMLSGLFKRKDKKIKVDEAAGNIVARQDENGSTVFSPTTSGRGSPSGRASPSTMLPQPSLRSSRSNSNPLKSSLANPSSPLNSTKGQDRPVLQGRKSPIPIADSGRTEATAEMRSEFTGPNAATERLVQFTNVSNDENASSGAPITRLRSPEPKYEPTQKPTEPTISPVNFTTRPELIINTTLPHSPVSVISPMSTSTLSTVYPFDKRPAQISPVETPGEPNITRSAVEAKTTETDVTNSGETKPPSIDSGLEATKLSLEATPKSSTEDSVLSNNAVSESVTTPDSSSPEDTPAPATPIGDVAPLNWNPRALRHYLDTQAIQDTKDMLIRVADTADVEPLPQDHPIMLELGFAEIKRNLDAIEDELDHLLMDYLTRHGIDF